MQSECFCESCWHEVLGGAIYNCCEPCEGLKVGGVGGEVGGGLDRN